MIQTAPEIEKLLTDGERNLFILYPVTITHVGRAGIAVFNPNSGHFQFLARTDTLAQWAEQLRTGTAPSLTASKVLWSRELLSTLEYKSLLAP